MGPTLRSDFVERLRAVPWHRIRVQVGDASDVPEALLALARTRDAAETDAAYWRLDNHVVVQGALYEAAFHVIPFVLELLADRAGPGRVALYDLLVEIANGQPAHPGDLVVADGGPVDLRAACRSRIRAGLDVARRDLTDGGADPPVRDRALDLLLLVERDRAGLRTVLRRAPDTGVPGYAEKLTRALERLDRG